MVVAVIGAFVATRSPGQGGSRELSYSQSADESATLTGATQAGSCAASACHGRPLDGTRRDSRSAFSAWASDDPHRRAFEVLYADRSVEIYRNLRRSRTTRRVASDEDNAEFIESAAYAEFLEQRCVGCHATIPQGYSAPAERRADADSSRDADAPPVGDAGHAQSAPDSHERDVLPDVLLDGITCESCHTMPPTAVEWRDKHYLTDWPSTNEKAIRALVAENDLSDLRHREAVCGSCHQGPKSVGDRWYDVSHDLIGAGHPLLAFEFATYLANYPKHWDEAADQERHARTTGGSFHSDAWRIGQQGAALRVAEQMLVRLGESSETAPWPELAQFRCADCHHGIRPTDVGQVNRESTAVGPALTAIRGATPGQPQPAFEVIDRWLALQGDQLESTRHARKQLEVVRTRLMKLEPPSDELLADLAELNARLLALPGLAPCVPEQLPAMGRFLQRNSPVTSGILLTNVDDRVDNGDDNGGTVSSRRLYPPTWDSHVSWLLAVDSLAHDLPENETTRTLRHDIQRLRDALSDQAHFRIAPSGGEPERAISIYDTPASFDPARVEAFVRQIADRLTDANLYARPATATPESPANSPAADKTFSPVRP